ncbi:MAG: acetate--CoA ligase family protein, partial [Deltaproteobacteria bacterium]|nr:acetate--CoA ligase family protein [Deltaproteobacteria bacterium]
MFLKEYGIPVINEKVALNKDEVVKAAEEIGFPVVAKGLGA